MSVTLPPVLVSTAVVAPLSVCLLQTFVMAGASVLSMTMKTFATSPVPLLVYATGYLTGVQTLHHWLITHNFVSCTPMEVESSLMTCDPTLCFFT